MKKFNESAYQTEIQKTLSAMEKGGAFKPLKAVMARHLSKAEWKTLFLGLSIASEITRASSQSTKKGKTLPLGRLQSFCGFEKGGPKLSAKEARLLRDGRLTGPQRRSIAMRIERATESSKSRKEIGVVFLLERQA